MRNICGKVPKKRASGDIVRMRATAQCKTVIDFDCLLAPVTDSALAASVGGSPAQYPGSVAVRVVAEHVA